MRRPAAAASILALLFSFAAQTTDAQIVSTFTGAGTARAFAMDASGRLYVSSRGVTLNSAPASPFIRRYSPPSTAAAIFANAADGLVDPHEMAFDDAGNLFVADYSAGCVHKFSPAGVASVAATATGPTGLTRDVAGNIYVGEYATRRILKIATDGTVSVYVAQAWPNAAERLYTLHMAPDGHLYGGSFGGTVYRIGPGGSPVTVFATGFGSIGGITSDPNGGFMVTTYDQNTIRKLETDGTHSLFAGPTTPVGGLVNGSPSAARFNYPSGILYSPTEAKFYIADWGNNVVRAIDYGTVPAQTTSWGRVKTLYR